MVQWNPGSLLMRQRHLALLQIKKKLKSVSVEAGLEVQPTESAKVKMPPTIKIDPDDDIDVANAEIPFEDWSHEDKVRAFVLPLIG